MGKTLLSLLVKLGLDSSEYDKGLENSEKKAGVFTNALLKVGGAAVMGGIAAVGAGFVALASTIGPASDLAETTSKVGVVFGDSAESVLAFGKQASISLGMSEQAALSAAGTYGNLFRSMGMTETVSADMSTGLVQLAGDLASFNNMGTEEVLDKLRAGLSGETEPLKSLGVNLNQAAVEAKAMSMGLIRNKKELTAAAKAQATYALITEQTTLAQGDFARTSDGVANQQRILAAQFDNLKASIGTKLLPVVQMGMGMLNNLFSDPVVQTGINIFTNGLEKISGFLTSLADVSSLEGFGFALQMAFGPQVGELFLQFKGYLEQAQTFFTGLWTGLVNVVNTFAPQIMANVQAFLGQLKIFWDAHGEQIMAVLTWLWNAALTVIGGALTLIVGVITATMAILNGDWATAWETIKNTLLTILNAALALAGTNLTAFVDGWRNNWEMAKLIVTTVFNNIVSFITGKVAEFVALGTNLMEGLRKGIISKSQSIIDEVIGTVNKAISWAKSLLGIKSPSKVFMRIGENMMLGMAKGIENSVIEPVMQVRAMSKDLVGAGGAADNRQFNFNYNGNATPQQIYQSYEMARAIG